MLQEGEWMKRIHLWKIVGLVLALVFPTLFFAASASAAGPTGAGPNDPMMVPTGDQTIAPNTTLWFYFDYVSGKTGAGGPGGRPGGGGLPPGGPGGAGGPGASASGQPTAKVTVDANGVGGLAFGVYTPDQAKSWLSDPTTQPVGQGTPYRDTSNGNIAHDLYWAGGFNVTGRYLIAVTNSNSNAVTFRMTVTGETVTLYPAAAASPTPALDVPVTVTPVPTGTIQGKIVFETSTGGEIWTVNGDGSQLTRVSRGIDPSWSADGKQIVFARWDNTNPGLYIANADGSNERLIYAANKIRWPRVSPDGKYIVFSQDKSKSDRQTIWKLGVVEVATGKLMEPQCSDLCYVPTWGKDSATIVYTDPNVGILKTNAFQGQATLIGPNGRWWDSSANISRPIVNWPAIENTELSPDGNRIVYSMQAHDRWEINVMTADGSTSTGITNPDPVLSILLDVVDHNVAPTWSNDSKEILFLSDRNGKWEFFVMNADGSGVTQVLKNVTDRVSLNFGYYNERMMDWTN